MTATNFVLVDPAAGAAQNAQNSSLTEAGGSILVNTNKVAIATATGNTAVAGTLVVAGAATVGALACTGALAVNTNKFTVASATGNTAVAGTLAVTGASTLTGALTASGGITVGAGFFTPVTTVNAATYNVLATDRILHVTYTATGACTIDLKTAQLVNGRRLIIKDAGGATGVKSITVTTEGAETIDGAASKVINAAYGVIELYCNGTHWYVV